MFSQRTTGQVGRAFRAVCLPFLLVPLLHPGLLAQAPGGGNTPALDAAIEVGGGTMDGVAPAANAAPADPATGKEDSGANPAPEPDTWVLAGTGALVLLLLYSRRRARVVATLPGATGQA
jgi:hypothetical protein